MVSREVAKLSEEFVMSVSLGEDIVGRLGVSSAEDLINNISHIIQACQLPKVRKYWECEADSHSTGQ